jgi:hypothetical protein
VHQWNDFLVLLHLYLPSKRTQLTDNRFETLLLLKINLK